MPSLEIVCGDITTLPVDAIVNTANPNLTPGGAAGMAIINAAGPELARAMAEMGSRIPGRAAITAGFALPAKYVIHAVGPSYLARGNEALQLAETYRSIFALAEAHAIRSIAMPAISCGLHAFPPEPAASIAVREAREAKVERVIFVAFTDEVRAAYERALEGTTEWITVLNGPIKKKQEIHRDGDWHVAVHIWLIAPDGRVLLQRRSIEKENWPGHWDVSAAGHVSAGETPKQAAVRETLEELGVRIEEDELERIGVLHEESALRGGTYIDREVNEIYAVQRELGKLTLQRGEVDAAMYVRVDELQTVRPLVPHEIEYRLLSEFVAKAARSR